MSEPLVRIDVNRGLATLTLNHPPVNALNADLIGDLHSCLHRLRTDSTLRAVVLTGGNRVFAAGGDVKEMIAWDYVTAWRDSSALGDACEQLARLRVPVVAAINGHALGGGCELALAADFRVCTTTTKLGFPEILLGLIPGAGGTQRLPRLVGVAQAKALVMTGRLVDSQQALSIGLVDRVVAPEDLHQATMNLVEPFLAGPAVALAAAKQAIDEGMALDLASGLSLERSLFNGLFATQDRQKGLESFLENGLNRARFTGH
jgi:enoyl-CoA hydratase/carnithine racemase